MLETLADRSHRRSWARIITYWLRKHAFTKKLLFKSHAPDKHKSLDFADNIVKQIASVCNITILEAHANSVRIGIRDNDIHLLHQFLIAHSRGATLHSVQKSGSRRKIAGRFELTDAFRAAEKLLVEWSHQNILQRLEIEIFWRLEDEYWLSSNSMNRDLRVVYSRPHSNVGSIQISDVLGGKPMNSVEEPIDCVVTWVNYNDPAWSKMHKDFSSVRPEVQGDGDAVSRYFSFDELKYCLRSIRLNMPWIRQIIVFTNCERPAWLIEHKDIRWVDHSSVIDENSLPIFNSHAIETYLHMIPGLSDRFIYMNDDFFILRNTKPDDFIMSNGVTKFFPEVSGVVSGVPRPQDPAYLNASRNSAAALLAKCGSYPTQILKHAPYALNREVLTEICDHAFADQISLTRGNRFRNHLDINLVSFLYHYYAYNNRLSAPYELNISYVAVEDIFWKEKLRSTLSSGAMVLCINSGGADRPSDGFQNTAIKFLESAFPNPGPWER